MGETKLTSHVFFLLATNHIYHTYTLINKNMEHNLTIVMYVHETSVILYRTIWEASLNSTEGWLI